MSGYDSALQAAQGGGHEKAVEMLTANGANMNAREEYEVARCRQHHVGAM